MVDLTINDENDEDYNNPPIEVIDLISEPDTEDEDMDDIEPGSPLPYHLPNHDSLDEPLWEYEASPLSTPSTQSLSGSVVDLEMDTDDDGLGALVLDEVAGLSPIPSPLGEGNLYIYIEITYVLPELISICFCYQILVRL